MVLEEIGTDLAFSVLAEGDLSNYDSVLHAVKRTEIYKSQAQLDNAVLRYIDNIPALEVDFTSNQVILITLGVQSNISNSFSVDGVVEFDDYVRLEVTYETLGHGCLALPAFIHPLPS